jgi:hypothetical protein
MPTSVPVTFAGTAVSIKVTAPSTYDATGFGAITAWVPIGEITSAPGSGGKTFEDVSYSVLAERATKHLKGTSDQAEQTFEVISDRDDLGQIELAAALDSDNQYSFKVTYNSGEIDYFQALVTGFEGQGGDANTLRKSTVTMRRDYRGVVTVLIP